LAAILPSLLFCYFSQPSWGDLLKFEITDWNSREGGGPLALINFCPLLRLAEFAVGIVLGCTFLERKPVKPEAASTLGWELLAILSGLVPIVLLTQPHVLPYPIIHNGILLPVWACLIYSLAASSRIRGVLGTKWLLLLGEASYGFYILQYPLSTMYKTALLYLFHLDVHGSYPTLPLLAGYLVILSVASIVSYRFLETPGRRALMRWFSRPAVAEIAYSVTPAVSR
jgi:peptidoglycan/LPS O-acetylase OafA/YrhL